MLRWLSILVVALALVAVGCGGSDDESAASDETTIEETTTTDETTATDETTTEESTDTSGIDTGAFNFASEDCQSLVKAYVGLSAAIAAASSGQDVTADIEKFSKYEDKVPEEIGPTSGRSQRRKHVPRQAQGHRDTRPVRPRRRSRSRSFRPPHVVGSAGGPSCGVERLNTWTTENCKS